MISSITLHKKKGNFTNKLYHYKNDKVTFNFTDGINVITGRNGCGKTVLLDIIKTCCCIDDKSTYPRMKSPISICNIFDDNCISIPEAINKDMNRKCFPDSDIIWDGNIVHHLSSDFFDPHDLWRLMDSPFPNQGTDLFSTGEMIHMMTSHKSKGEGAIYLLSKIFNLPIEYDKPLENVNDMWMKASNVFQDWLNAFPQEKNKPTLLIDELDSHLDLDNQFLYWKYINNLSAKWQVIVVSHSIFAFKQNELNQMPLNFKYFKSVQKL